MKELSWKPRVRGDVYCSPACGRGCTRAEYQHADKMADKLVIQLGVGWRARVWENLGWHYEAKAGEWSVYPSGDRMFLASNGQFGAAADTPAEAVAAARAAVIEAAKKLMDSARALP